MTFLPTAAAAAFAVLILGFELASSASLVALFVNGSFNGCGGSLIGERTVLSAAHCVVVNQHRPQDWTIRYGTTDITKGEEVKVVKVIAHPGFTLERLDYDISVLLLEKPFHASSRAKVIPLAKVDPADGAHLSISGWGMRNISSSEETRFLQYGDSVRVVNRSSCNSPWHSLFPITERMLCAGSASQAFCHGDSGSGAVSLLNSVPTLVGVFSFSLINCSTTDPQPSVLADVAHLRPWIEANSAK
ncbi:hypothetical protein TYRP_020791 [Tyrophagus putrescentiae]|nr:hypothetical protein TYRP_020791 [Tyrophagus putrescentiae]